MPHSKLIIASNNKGKIREFKQLLEPLGYEVMSQSEAGICLEVEETGKTFEENARLKAQATFEMSKTPVIADDSGLCVDSLGGEPGVYTANYNIAWLLEKMKDIPKDKRAAKFVCCLCMIDEHGEKIICGECEGYIGFKERGDKGFGYDPVFMVGDKSFAEISDTEKNKISHRGKALRKLVEKLK
jgi:XTP/dITP diphosphohydrolase